MVKTELVKEIANKVNEANTGIEVKKDTVSAVLDALTDVIKDAVKKDDKVSIPDIGSFTVKTVKERTGTINLGSKKGETYSVPEHKEPKFTMSPKLKKILV